MRSFFQARWATFCLLLIVAGCPPTPAPVTPVLGPENCKNNLDDNGDGKIDCLDPKCIETSSCVFGEICDNARDDNNNLLIDCADQQCEGQGCGLNCLCVGGAKQFFDTTKDAGGQDAGRRDAGAGVDSGTSDAGTGQGDAGTPDGGSTDAGKIDAGTPPVTDSGVPVVDSGVVDSGTPVVDAGNPCATCNTGCTCVSGVMTETTCLDSTDNDHDFAVDCADTDCVGASCGAGCTCVINHKTEVFCSDGLDNNNIAGADCSDPDCLGQSCGTGCECAANRKKEVLCDDSVDNNLLSGTDCFDPDCLNQRCGDGCVCGVSVKKETNCSDSTDNDGDGFTDCADSDCVGAGTEVCDDGLDNTCDRAIDCGDSKCMGNPKCTANVNDGKPCLADGQCAGGKCFSEAGDGLPNGFCANQTSCTVGTNAGCFGGFCLAPNGGGFNNCRVGCTGNGLGATGRCRVGYACSDPDGIAGTLNSFCLPSCTSDLECSGNGSGYGCNVFSKRCEAKTNTLLGYGAACTANSQCKGLICLTDTATHRGGYCSGNCRNDLKNCGDASGYCDAAPDAGDNLSLCLRKCDFFSDCRRPDRYGCWQFTPRQSYSACQCAPSGANISSAPAFGDTCCSGSATSNICN